MRHLCDRPPRVTSRVAGASIILLCKGFRLTCWPLQVYPCIIVTYLGQGAQRPLHLFALPPCRVQC